MSNIETKLPPSSFAESWVCGRADVSVQLHGDLCDEQVGLPYVLAVLVSTRPQFMLLSTQQEEEQLQSAQHKQPGTQHHTDKREANGQQVVFQFWSFVCLHISVSLDSLSPNLRICMQTADPVL